jgi:HK97 family phage major capsid protein
MSNNTWREERMRLLTSKYHQRSITSDEVRELRDLTTDAEIDSAKSAAWRETGGTGRGHERTQEDRAFDLYLRTGDTHGMNEARATPGMANTDATSQAGFLVPQGFWENLQVALKAFGGASNDFNLVETDTGNPMPWPTVDPTNVVASVLTPELTTLSTADPYIFGQGMLNAWTIATNPVLASVQLIQDSAFAVDQFLAERFGEQIGRAKAAYAWTGTGSAQPLGMYPAITAYGVKAAGLGGVINLTAATTVKTFAGTPTELVSNTLSPQTLINMVEQMDPAYYFSQNGAKWYMTSIQAWNLRTVVDTTGRPLINFANGFDVDSLNGPMTNAPDGTYNSNSPVAMLLGFPVVIDNSATALTASTVSGPVFANLSHAFVQRRVKTGVTVMRLDQRWADMLAVGFIGYERCDFRSNDLRAMVAVKPAAT